MRKLPAMADMARSTEEKEALPSLAEYSQPDYPYGLHFCLTEQELSKLDLDDDVEVGDYIHVFAFAKVTSVSKNEVNGEPKCRIELCMTHIALEDESEENEEEDEKEPEFRPLG